MKKHGTGILLIDENLALFIFFTVRRPGAGAAAKVV